MMLKRRQLYKLPHTALLLWVMSDMWFKGCSIMKHLAYKNIMCIYPESWVDKYAIGNATLIRRIRWPTPKMAFPEKSFEVPPPAY